MQFVLLNQKFSFQYKKMTERNKCPLFNDQCPYLTKQREQCPYLNKELDFEKTGAKCPLFTDKCPYLNKKKEECPYIKSKNEDSK